MRLVVADTGPLNYLVLTGDIELLPKLFDKVATPRAVQDELASSKAPAAVQDWIARSPPWLEIHPDPSRGTTSDVGVLDRGEQAAIALAVTITADLVLMDDQEGVAVARRMGLKVTGTLGVFTLAAQRGLIDLEAAFARLKTTNFRYRPEIMDTLLAQHHKRGTT